MGFVDNIRSSTYKKNGGMLIFMLGIAAAGHIWHSEASLPLPF
jgi:hypothetical protein